MKLAAHGPDALAYRLVKPRSACNPLCGRDVAEKGGRFTRPGIAALYLGEQPETALAEYAQGAARLEPAMFVTYCVHLPRIVDLTAGYRHGMWPPEWRFWDMDWRAAQDAGHEPESWQLGDALRAAGLCGLRFPSTKREGGTNLLLLPDLLCSQDRVTVHDREGSLPRNGSSWD